MEVALVIVGDEILSGHVRDENSPFIAGRVASLGHRLARMAVIGDDPDAIAAEIARERDAGARLVVTSGGLGSTHDDCTMEGVARTFGRPLERCAPLADVIEGVIDGAREAGLPEESLGAQAMRKMAMVPAGAELLRCSVAFIPAVAVDEEGFSVAVLPGPPDQFARVFDEAVVPRYLDGTGRPVLREEVTHAFPESTFADLLAELQERFPATSIGSYPQRDHTLIRVAGSPDDARQVGGELRSAIQAVERSDDGQRLLAYLRARRARG